MRAAASRHAHRPLLKLKLGADPDTDIKRLQAARTAAPQARLIVDANEGWSIDALKIIAPIASDLGVELLDVSAGQTVLGLKVRAHRVAIRVTEFGVEDQDLGLSLHRTSDDLLQLAAPDQVARVGLGAVLPAGR